jgi:DNA transformation protein
MKASEGLDARARKLYGGMGVYTGEKMFAILLDDVVSLKLSPEHREEALQLNGATVFRPAPDMDEMPEYIVMPTHVLDDQESFRHWLLRSAEYARNKAKVIN